MMHTKNCTKGTVVWLASGGSDECSTGVCFDRGMGNFSSYKTKRMSFGENLTVVQTEITYEPITCYLNS